MVQGETQSQTPKTRRQVTGRREVNPYAKDQAAKDGSTFLPGTVSHHGKHIPRVGRNKM